MEYRIYRKNGKGQYEYLCTGDGARWVSDSKSLENARAEITNEIRNPVDRDHQLLIGDIFWLAGEYYISSGLVVAGLGWPGLP